MLYHTYTKDLPIIDFHCQLDPKKIAHDKQFDNITDIWLRGNGGLLHVVAMKAAGWDGAPDKNTLGFPDNGNWVVKWEGLRPVTPDGIPLIGRTKQIENLLVAAGHAIMGVSLAPITGKIKSDFVDGKQGGSFGEIYCFNRF